jgi:hypothetical protein
MDNSDCAAKRLLLKYRKRGKKNLSGKMWQQKPTTQKKHKHKLNSHVLLSLSFMWGLLSAYLQWKI